MDNTHDTLFGKMFPEHFQAIKAGTSSPSSARLRKLPTPTYMCLNLKESPIDLLGNTRAKWSGGGWSISWRTMDAQYWGVPQRRRRIYLVADFAGECAGEILFERTSMSGNPESRRTPREEATANAGRSVDGGSSVKCLNPWDCQSKRQYSIDGVYRTLDAGQAVGGQAHGIVYPIAACTLAVKRDTNLHIGEQQQTTVSVAAFMGGQGAKARSIAYCDDGTTPTIKSVLSGGNTIPDVVYAADCRNYVLSKELSTTLQANGSKSLNGQNPIIYSSNSYGALSEGVGTLGTGSRATAEMVAVYPEVTGSLCANSHPGSYTGQDAFNNMLPVVPSDKPPRKYIVRRLTPLECCRLQGFPDWWTEGCENFPITGWWIENNTWMRVIDPHGAIEGSDSAKYKMWGNGMALPNMLHVMRRITERKDDEKTVD